MLTAADVEQKTFSTALRGYDLDEVDDFLDEIVTTLRSLNEQLEEARASADSATAVSPMTGPEPIAVSVPEPEPEPDREAEPETEPFAGAPPTPGIDESAIGRALIAAQTAADRLLEDARGEADKIVEGAKSEADSWTEEREAKRREAESEIARLTERVASVRSELSVLAGEVADKLDEMDSAIHGAVETDVATPADVGEATPEVVDGGNEGENEPAAERWGYSVEEPARDTEPEDSSPGADHLDAMLTGVVNDLQLASDEPQGQDHRQDESSEGVDRDHKEEEDD